MLVGCSLAHGMLTMYLGDKVLQKVAESIWKGICVLFLESGFAKVSRMKWPFSLEARGQVGAVSWIVKQFSYSLGAWGS